MSNRDEFTLNLLPIFTIILMKLVTHISSEILCSLVEPSNCDCVLISDSPGNSGAVYDTDVLLRCQVDGVVGEEVQWTKDGVALGADPNIPGYPRYSMTDNADNSFSGNYDLIITTVKLEDEGYYQCQVTNCNIQSPEVVLTVLVPPYGPVIIDEEPSGEYRVVVDQTIQIKCEAWNAKPAADVSWYKGNDQITEGVTKETYPSETELYNSSAALKLTPNLNDDQALYTCIMNNDALISEDSAVISAQKNDITIIVLVPPTDPTIDNFDPSDGTITVGEGSAFTIICRSEKGKPVPTVIWYRENVALSSDVVYDISLPDVYGRQNVTAILQRIGNVTDDDARFTCKVENEAMEKPKTISFILQVSTPLDPVVIVAIVLGGVLFLFLLIFFIIYLCRKRKNNKNESIIAQQHYDKNVEASAIAREVVHGSSLSFRTKSSASVPEQQSAVDSVASLSSEEILTASTNPAFEAIEQSYSDDTTLPAFSTESSTSNTDSDIEQDATPPGGDVFSLSSSMRRSDRGSPVDFIDEDVEILSIPTLQNNSWLFSHYSTLNQAYVVRSPAEEMITTV